MHVHQLRNTQLNERLLPYVKAVRSLLQEHQLPPVVAKGGKIAVIRPVQELMPRVFLCLALEIRHQVVAVQMDLESTITSFVASQELFLDIRYACCCYERGN